MSIGEVPWSWFMAERNSSSTAMRVAELRAAHQLIDGEPKILHDPVVLRLLDAEVLDKIRTHPGVLAAPWLMGMRSHILLRSRYTEDLLAQSGIDQFVVLGAGYDTFAYRQPEWARKLRIFEVDQPASQAAKRELLASKGIQIASNLEFVSMDFEQVSLKDGLAASRLDFSRPAFFSCLGVLVYLTQETAYDLFRQVASFPKKSEIAFTFSQPDSVLDATEAARREILATAAGSMGEPWRTHFDSRELILRLSEIGFSKVTILHPRDAHTMYFAGRTDGLKPPRRENVASARV